MDSIAIWFENDCDFNEGLILYKGLPNRKSKVLKSLERGKSSYNQSLLIKELRTYKHDSTSSNEPSVEVEFENIKSQPSTTIDDLIIQREHSRNQQKEKGLKSEYGGVKYADLPNELRPRYRELGMIFYKMCDLKFLLNDVPPEDAQRALSIQLKIEDLDSQRMLIWREIDHWLKHRVMPPTKADVFSGMTSDQLRTEKAKAQTNISKLKKRVETKYDLLINNADNSKNKRIEDGIRRTESRIHQHELNINKINTLLK